VLTTGRSLRAITRAGHRAITESFYSQNLISVKVFEIYEMDELEGGIPKDGKQNSDPNDPNGCVVKTDKSMPWRFLDVSNHCLFVIENQLPSHIF